MLGGKVVVSLERLVGPSVYVALVVRMFGVVFVIVVVVVVFESVDNVCEYVRCRERLRGPMDKASAYEAGDCVFESRRRLFSFASHTDLYHKHMDIHRTQIYRRGRV
jgi:hypothetical protein